MSILVKEDYANPEKPLWAQAGGSAPMLLDGNENGMVIYEVPDTNLNTIILSEPVVSVAGKFLLTATFNCYGVGFNNTFYCYIRDAPSGYNSESIVSTTDYPHQWVSASTSLVFPWEPEDDPPAFQFQVQTQSDSGPPYVYLTYSVVFYPTPP